MTKAFVALFIAALLMASPVLADDCYFQNGLETLRFGPPTDMAVTGKAEYFCTTSSGGTGVTARVAHCSDGYEGVVAFNEDETVTFRSAVWKSACEEGDLSVLDLMGN